MTGYILLLLFTLLLVINRIYLSKWIYYSKVQFGSFLFVNCFTIVWFLIQYYFLNREYGIAEVDASISIIPGIFLSLFWFFLLGVLYNVLYVILNLYSRVRS